MPVVQPNIFVQSGGGSTQEYTAGDGIDITDNVITNTAIPDVDKDYVDGSITALDSRITQTQSMLTGKQDAPATAGTAGQVLGLNDNLQPVWVTGGGGGGTPTNMVTTDTAQTITGVKTLQNVTASAPASSIMVRFIAKYALENYGTLCIGDTITLGESQYSSVDGALIPAVVRKDATIVNFNSQAGIAFRACHTQTLATNPGVSVCMLWPQKNNSGKLPLNPTSLQWLPTMQWVRDNMPDVTFTGDGSASYTVAHTLGKIPSIVQVTGPDGVVLKDSEVTITKTTTNVTVTFETAPESGTYTVGMLY